VNVATATDVIALPWRTQRLIAALELTIARERHQAALGHCTLAAYAAPSTHETRTP